MVEEELIPIRRLVREAAFSRNGRPAAISTPYRLHRRGKMIPNSNGKRVFLKFTYLPSGTFVRRSDLNAFIAELNSTVSALVEKRGDSTASKFLDNAGLI